MALRKSLRHKYLLCSYWPTSVQRLARASLERVSEISVLEMEPPELEYCQETVNLSNKGSFGGEMWENTRVGGEDRQK